MSVAVEALRREHLPFISVLFDPTYGGVSASYAMQADVRIGVSDARIGFAGPAVILNTMCEANQARFDEMCPADFQSAPYVLEHGQLDLIIDAIPGEKKEALQKRVEDKVAVVASLLLNRSVGPCSVPLAVPATEADINKPFNYLYSRTITRPQAQDFFNYIVDSFVELSGDGKLGSDVCLRGGVGYFEGRACMVIGTTKGHTPQKMQEANYGMASPHGYRMALRLMQLAERFGLPVLTLVDTVGAWPTFECERDGQSEAIATNLTAMASLRVPIVTLVIGEGGSGGALGIGMGNKIGMLSGAYFGVISPEGAASILGRYKNDAQKATQFPKDCQELATAQCIYAYQLKSIGVIDEIIWESAESDETFNNFPILSSRIRQFIASSFNELCQLTPEEIVAIRYQKFRALGTFSILDDSKRSEAVAEAQMKCGKSKPQAKQDLSSGKLLTSIAETSVTGNYSRYRKLAPVSCPLEAPAKPSILEYTSQQRFGPGWTNAKRQLDLGGPEALVKWVKEQKGKRVLLTDTTMRDAHQSLLATRVRTEDLVKGAAVANELLKDAFSFECWGGATFDVAMRFLDECPWQRLRELRAACPDVCLQMLIRGANAVGYTSYPDNVVTEFVRLAALNGMDIFRIFDCFNIVENMKVAIDAVRAANKVAEVCICYTGNVLTSEVYNLEYYTELAREIAAAGAHMIAIKDMAGLLRPLEGGPLLAAIRSVTDLPVHFHTHATSSGSIATCVEMAQNGCEIIDFCTASMADGTSQPSLNAFVAMMEGAVNDTGFRYMDLEPYDMYWSRVRDIYSPFESGMKSGSARVFEHQIPGGQYSNLIVQCQSMGLWSRWEEILDAYRDVNDVLGDIVKVTPSSKCVGDLALYLVTMNKKASDLLDPLKASSIDFPESVVGLIKGDLGFPHRGFPEAIEAAILKGAAKRTIRAGLTLPPADFAANISALSTKFSRAISPEEAMSSLMYPKVFEDFMNSQVKKSQLVRFIPSPVYFYGMVPGSSFTMSIPPSQSDFDDLRLDAAQIAQLEGPNGICITVTLERISSLKDRHRTVVFRVNGKEQHVQVKDTSGVFVFEGPMASNSDPAHIGSPMPGVIEKVLVAEGQMVHAGDVLCTVSAMKMEVKVTAPRDCKIDSISAGPGTRVVEGALIVTLK